MNREPCSPLGGGVGTRETIIVDKNGNTVSDKPDDVEIDQNGDWGPKTSASPRPGSGSSGSSADPDPDPDPDSDHPSTGEESESDDTGDGGFGDDTGPPGLGWDGAQDSPRHFLPDGSVDDGTAGCDGQLDNLGAGMSIFLADVMLNAWNRPGGAEGLGEDVTGVATPIEVDLSTVTPHSVADPEGNWGDFTNPKAHLELLDSIRLDAQKLGAPDVHIGALNSLGSVLLNSALVQSAQISSLA